MRRFLRVGLIVCGVLGAGFASASGQGAADADRVADGTMPFADSEIRDARERVKRLFADAMKDRSPAAAQELAVRLRDEAGRAVPGTPAHYVFLDEALTAASRSDDSGLLVGILDQLLAAYPLDVVATGIRAFLDHEVAARDPVALAVVADRMRRLHLAAAKAGHDREAATLHKRLKDLAKKQRWSEFQAWLAEDGKELEFWKKLHSKAAAAERRLAANPDQPRAHADAARHDGLVTDNWPATLEHLRAANDDWAVEVSADQALERAGLHQATADLFLERANAWVALAEKERDHGLRQVLYRRADHWVEVSGPWVTDALARLELEQARRTWQVHLPPRVQFLVERTPVDVHVGDHYPMHHANRHRDPPIVLMVGERYWLHTLFLHPGNDGVHAFARHDLGGAYQQFDGMVGLSNSAGRATNPMTFVILGDDEVLWKSKPVREQKDQQEFEVSVEGIDRLEIQVHVEGWNGHCHALWIEPRLSKGQGR